jgi:hypothetical protein
LGQKAINALTESPVINCISDMARASQNGMDGAKTNMKKFKGDRIGGAPSSGAASHVKPRPVAVDLIGARRMHRA